MFNGTISANVWAARKKLDGRCDYRKRWENLSKRSFSQQECRQEGWVTNGTATAQTIRLWVTGKQKLSKMRFRLPCEQGGSSKLVSLGCGCYV